MGKWVWMLLIVGLLGGLVLSVSGPAAAQSNQVRELTPAELAKVEAGEIILESQSVVDAKGNSRGRGLAIGYMKAGKDKVMDTILKYEDYPQFMPRVKTTQVYDRTDTSVGVTFTIEVVLVKVTYNIMHKIDRANGIISWTLDKNKKNEIAGTDGTWVLKPYKDGVLVYYSVLVDTGRSIPKSIEDYLTKKDLPNIVKSMKKRVGG